ncbi:MAG TPA: S49 family peptidase, partial [Bacteroidales bacterium]|nr:S49 family peptidase [Bacteroidales bacterium]
MFEDMSELYTKKLGINYSEVKTNRNSVFGASGHPFTQEQMGLLQNNVNHGYLIFKKRVAEGRHMSIDQVENIAQGRVWSGTDALKIGLIDTIGGVNTAIAIADKKAQLGGNYNLQIYPEQKSAIEIILDKISGQQSLSKEIEALFGKEIAQISTLTKEIPKQQGIYMQLPYILKIN